MVVGDRLNTDILGAANSGMESLLVLTGVSGALDLWRAQVDERPQHLGADLTALFEPPLDLEVDRDSVGCGPAVARLEDRLLQITGSGSAKSSTTMSACGT